MKYPIPDLPKYSREIPTESEFLLARTAVSSTCGPVHKPPDGCEQGLEQGDVRDDSQVGICGQGHAHQEQRVPECVHEGLRARIRVHEAGRDPRGDRRRHLGRAQVGEHVYAVGLASEPAPKPVDKGLVGRLREIRPLTVYASIAATEAASHSMDINFWRSLHPPIELVSYKYTDVSLIEDNNLVSMGTEAGDEENWVIENRIPLRDHRRVLQPTVKGGRRVRLSEASTTIRAKTSRTIQMACTIQSGVEKRVVPGVGHWMLGLQGFTTVITRENLVAMLHVWKHMCEINMPTMHVFESRDGLPNWSYSYCRSRPGP